MDRKRHKNLINAVARVLSTDERILFAYLYGSALTDMKPDPIRIKGYLTEIRKNSIVLNQSIDQNELVPFVRSFLDKKWKREV